MAQHAGYARVAFNFALSSFKVGLDTDEWRSHIDIKREFNAVKYDKFDWCEDLSQNASKNAIHHMFTVWKPNALALGGKTALLERTKPSKKDLTFGLKYSIIRLSSWQTV